jgi:hypothetical protein
MTYRKSFLLALPVLASLSFTASPASALTLVNVDLRNANVLNNIANGLHVSIRNIPITVQAPVNIAVQVCGVSALILSQDYLRGGASCYANQSSFALLRVVQRVMTLNSP